MELISRNDVIEVALSLMNDTNKNIVEQTANEVLHDVIQCVHNIPTIEERKEGHWIKHFDEAFPGDSTIECSVCHEEQYTTIDDYFCPNCGAKMKGADDED